MSTQQEHLPLASGTWGGGTRWEFFASDHPPDAALFTTVACVALRYLSGPEGEPEVVLTYNDSGRGTDAPGSWEVLGGHIDPLDPSDPDGPKETARDALDRESLEEAGFVIKTATLYGYRRVTNPPGSQYPELSYMPYYWATTDEPLRTPTDPDPPPCATLKLEAVQRLAGRGRIQPDELLIIEHGVAAALRHSRGRQLP